MYIVQFQDPGRDPIDLRQPVEQTFDAFMRKPVPRGDAPAEQVVRGVGASPRLNLAFSADDRRYDRQTRSRTPILSPEEKKVFVDTFTKSGFTGGINWYRNMSRNWQRSAGLDHTVRVPSLMIMARERSRAAAVGGRRMEKIIPIWRNTWSGTAATGRSRKTGRGQRQAESSGAGSGW